MFRPSLKDAKFSVTGLNCPNANQSPGMQEHAGGLPFRARRREQGEALAP